MPTAQMLRVLHICKERDHVGLPVHKKSPAKKWWMALLLVLACSRRVSNNTKNILQEKRGASLLLVLACSHRVSNNTKNVLQKSVGVCSVPYYLPHVGKHHVLSHVRLSGFEVAQQSLKASLILVVVFPVVKSPIWRVCIISCAHWVLHVKIVSSMRMGNRTLGIPCGSLSNAFSTS